jgi:hypothetical protein
MLIANHSQLGESANELVKKFGNSAYRYGAPDFYAAEFPVRPMHYDRSRIYSGVIGRHYPNAQTSRYHTLYDPNMYMQPGFGAAGGMTVQDAIRVFEQFLKLTSTWHSFDVVYDTKPITGVDLNFINGLWIVHGGTVAQLKEATAVAGGVVGTQTLSADLAKRIERAQKSDPTIVKDTFGKLDDVHNAIENMIAALKTGETRPVPVGPVGPTPIVVTQAASPATRVAASLNPTTWSRRTKIVAGATVGMLLAGGLAAVLLTRH